MPLEVQPRPKIRYKQPRRLNAVSIAILAFMALIGYGMYAIWPAFSLRSNVESELADALPNLWRLNHLADSAVRMQLPQLKRNVIDNVRKAGVRDKKLEVIFERNKKSVAIEARFSTSFTFPGTVQDRDPPFQAPGRDRRRPGRVVRPGRGRVRLQHSDGQAGGARQRQSAGGRARRGHDDRSSPRQHGADPRPDRVEGTRPGDPAAQRAPTCTATSAA